MIVHTNSLTPLGCRSQGKRVDTNTQGNTQAALVLMDKPGNKADVHHQWTCPQSAAHPQDGVLPATKGTNSDSYSTWMNFENIMVQVKILHWKKARSIRVYVKWFCLCEVSRKEKLSRQETTEADKISTCLVLGWEWGLGAITLFDMFGHLKHYYQAFDRMDESM